MAVVIVVGFVLLFKKKNRLIIMRAVRIEMGNLLYVCFWVSVFMIIFNVFRLL